MHNSSISNLFMIIDYIEDDHFEIASNWVEIPKVNAVFKLYKISETKFRDSFAIPIIEYFIAVVRKEKSVGNCPIMSKLVKFLLDKNITPREVFDICMGFRKILVSHLFKKHLIKGNASEIMDEVAELFDANLSGVLEVFTTFYQQQQEEAHSSNVHKKKFKQISRIINFINSKILIVQNGRVIMANKALFDTIGVEDIKSLYEKYEDGLSYMKVLNRDFEYFALNDLELTFSNISKSKEAFEVNIYNVLYGRDFTYSGRITTLPDTNPTEYIVTLNNIETYIKEQHDIKEELTHDSLTGLNNYSAFYQIMKQEKTKALESSTNLALVIVGVPSLSEIKKHEGSKAADDLIIEISEDIKSFVDTSMFVAHIEGSRFGILMRYETEEECYTWCNSLLIELNKKDEKKTLSVTAIDLAESVNMAQIRAYELIDIANSSENNIVRSDFDDIESYHEIGDQDKYINILKDISEINTALYFKDLPVKSVNKIIRVDNISAVILLSKKQLSIIEEDNLVYFELPSLGPIKASIANIDKNKMLATIDKFKVDKHSPLQRQKFRIEAIENTVVRIISGPIIEGVLLNLNYESIAVKINRKRNLYDGSLVSVSMMLHLDDELIKFNSEATVQRIEKIKDAYKVILLYNADIQNRKTLKDYLAKRQIEVIQELSSQ